MAELTLVEAVNDCLHTELARDDWLVGPADAALIFDIARERVWDEAMAHRLP